MPLVGLADSRRQGINKKGADFMIKKLRTAVDHGNRNFVTDLLASIRERGVDTKSAYVIFIGGGAALLKRILEKADRLERHFFIEDLCANAKGYDILYRMNHDGM